jgi:hypothetical protein
VSYVDAGYAVGLSVLFLYAIGLMLRRRSLERRVDLSVSGDGPEGSAETGAAGGP